MIDLEMLLRVPYVDPNNGFDISPDGAQVAFSWNKTGQWELYQLPLPPLDSHRPTPVTKNIPGAKFAPKYSPDGSRLAYAVDFDGGENFHLFIHDFGTGSHTDLTSDVKFALQPNFCWSSDGKQIAYISNQNGNFDAYVMPSTGGVAKCVLSINRPCWDVH